MKKERNIQIGNRVRAARKKRNLSRAELAEQLNVSVLFVSYIECGQKGMSIETLIHMCDILQVSADYLLLREKMECREQTAVNAGGMAAIPCAGTRIREM